jgi:RimJ/RimL family protein N-acetyltransferase
LSFRSFTPADAPESFQHATAAVTRYLSWDPPASLDAFAQTWREWPGQAAAGSDAHLVVRTLAGDFIGACGIHFRGEPEPDIGLWIKQPAWGQGYGRETVGALLAWIAANLGVAAVRYPVVSGNVASRRIVEGFGGARIAERKRTKPRETGETTLVFRIAVRAPA